PNVLAIPLGHLRNEITRRTQDLAAVALIGANLRAADEELVRPVDGREGVGTRSRTGSFVPRSDFRLPRFGFQVLPHPLPSPLSPEPRFAIPPKPRGRV